MWGNTTMSRSGRSGTSMGPPSLLSFPLSASLLSNAITYLLRALRVVVHDHRLTVVPDHVLADHHLRDIAP